MKRFLVLVVAVMLALMLTACGGNSSSKALVGMWKAVDTETQTEYGLGIEFTKDGTLTFDGATYTRVK